MAIDYAFKSFVLNNYNDLLIAQRKASMLSYSLALLHTYGVVNYAVRNYDETYDQLKNYCLDTGLYKEFQECERINHAWFERVKRLKDRISSILSSSQASFITLTFDDATLNDTSAETRRRYVARWCKTYGVPYVANVDFGKTTHREHYHVIIACKVLSKTWNYGFMDIKSINCLNAGKSDIERLSKYIAKLTNHCIKETSNRWCLLYSRNV